MALSATKEVRQRSYKEAFSKPAKGCPETHGCLCLFPGSSSFPCSLLCASARVSSVLELSDEKQAVEVRFCLPGTRLWGKQEEENAMDEIGGKRGNEVRQDR